MCFTIDQFNRACGLLLLNEYDTFIYCCKNCTREFESGSHLEVHILSEHQEQITDAFVHDDVFVENFDSTVVEIGQIKVEPFEAENERAEKKNVEKSNTENRNTEEVNFEKSRELHLELHLEKAIEPHSIASYETNIQDHIKSNNSSSDEDDIPLVDFLMNDDFDNGNSGDESIKDKHEVSVDEKQRKKSIEWKKPPAEWRKNNDNGTLIKRLKKPCIKRPPGRPMGSKNIKYEERTYSMNEDIEILSRKPGRPTTGVFHCDMCPQLSFNGKMNLKRHMHHCHVKPKRKCEICGKLLRFGCNHQTTKPRNDQGINNGNGGEDSTGSRLGVPAGEEQKISHNEKQRKIGRPPGAKNKRYDEKTYSTNGDGKASRKKWGRPYTGTFYCDLCPQLSFDGKMNLKQHMHHCHVKHKRKCEICNKYPRFGYERHMKKFHTVQPLHKCNLCDAAFKIPISLEVHMRNHRGERPYLCEACGKSFVSQALYKKHENTVHNNIRNYQCQQCDLSFHYRYRLRDHINAFHTMERPFVCEICNKGFAAASYLRVHRKTHGEKTLPCRYCDRMFKLCENRYKHEVSIHKVVKGKTLN